MARILYHHRIRADDGQAVHVRELIGALRRAGHEVLECALVPKAGDAVPKAGDGLPGANGSDPRSRFWQRIHLPRRAQEALEILYNYRAVPRLVKAAAELRPDLIYERHALHCWAGVEAARRLGVPLFLEVNAPLCDEMEDLGLLRYSQNARRTERRVLTQADRVLAVTSVLRERLVQAGAPEARLSVVGNGAQPERYGEAQRKAAVKLRSELGLGPDSFVLGFSGFLRPWHRLDLALEAMALLPMESLHLLVVGTGPALDPLLQKASQMGLSQRIHAPGEVSPDALPAHVCAFDAALITSADTCAQHVKMPSTSFTSRANSAASWFSATTNSASISPSNWLSTSTSFQA